MIYLINLVILVLNLCVERKPPDEGSFYCLRGSAGPEIKQK